MKSVLWNESFFDSTLGRLVIYMRTRCKLLRKGCERWKKAIKHARIVGRKMKQQFVGEAQHCKCGLSWKKDIGYFERTSDMVFGLQKDKNGKQKPIIK